MENQVTFGTCGICGGAVTVPAVWHGIIPPPKTCSQCGAVAVESHGPVLPMHPRQYTNVETKTSTNSDYTAALRVYEEFMSTPGPNHSSIALGNFIEQRLNSAKAPNCA